MSEFKEYNLASNCITIELSNLQKQEFRVASSKVNGVIITGDYIHVVEYAALEQANEKIKKLEAKLAIAVEALEFYADLDSWKSSVSGDYIIDRIRYDDLETKHFNMSNPSVGGKKARQALEKRRV